MSYLIFRFIGLFLELHVEADAKQVGGQAPLTWSEEGGWQAEREGAAGGGLTGTD